MIVRPFLYFLPDDRAAVRGINDFQLRKKPLLSINFLLPHMRTPFVLFLRDKVKKLGSAHRVEEMIIKVFMRPLLD